MFTIAERLHQPIAVVEGMSAREVQAWVDYWSEAPAAPATVDDAIDMSTLSKAQLRTMFPGR
ncbi:MAG TPA: hypothetical protein VN680_02480 [Burkholderiaceae bacterium]|nr:hypothetical protein [Burkholderiaceae bacterium]